MILVSYMSTMSIGPVCRKYDSATLEGQPMSTTRNAIFILCDQLHAGYLGHAGHPLVKTPHLDRLVARGARLTNAVCANPICTPSRVSFLSGQYCHNHQYYGLGGINPNGLPSFLGHATNHGYHTAAVGKIHCPEFWIEQHTVAFHETCNCSATGRSTAYQAFLGSRVGLEDHVSMPDFGDKGMQSMDARPSPLTFAESQEGWIASETNRQIDTAVSAQKPFVLHASLPRPHQCTAPSQEFWDMYTEADILDVLPPTVELDLRAAKKAPHLIKTSAGWANRDWPLIEPRTFIAARARKLRGYIAAITQVDAAVGQIIDHLQQCGLTDSTLIIFSADHGEYATEFGIMEKAPGICGNAVTHIPLIIAGPQIQSGMTITAPVHAVDIAPTLCAQLGLPAMVTADGVNLSPALAGAPNALDSNRILVTENAWSKAVRLGRWRLVWYADGMFADDYPNGFGELYDLETDPNEQHNRWFDADCAATVVRLERALLNWLITTTRLRTVLGASNHPSLGPDVTEHFKDCKSQADGKIPGMNLLTTAAINYL